jgi:hypothetical protein
MNPNACRQVAFLTAGRFPGRKIDAFTPSENHIRAATPIAAEPTAAA